jgi:S1-C subfamily serine protease
MVFFLSNIAYCGSICETVEDGEYLALGSEYSNVVQLEIEMDHGVLAVGSGVIIDENWILTAAHALTVAKSIKIKQDDIVYKSIKIIPHEEFTHDSGLCDIGLVKFDKKFNMKKYPKLSLRKDIVGEKVVIAGFGTLIKANNPGFQTLDLKRRAGTNIVDEVEDHLLVCSMSKDNGSDLEFILSGGDSGGGTFIGRDELIGINSCTMATDGKTDGSYGDCSGHTMVSLFIDWIEEKKNSY